MSVWFQKDPVTGSEEKPQPVVNAVCDGQSGTRRATGGNSVNNGQNEAAGGYSLPLIG